MVNEVYSRRKLKSFPGGCVGLDGSLSKEPCYATFAFSLLYYKKSEQENPPRHTHTRQTTAGARKVLRRGRRSCFHVHAALCFSGAVDARTVGFEVEQEKLGHDPPEADARRGDRHAEPVKNGGTAQAGALDEVFVAGPGNGAEAGGMDGGDSCLLGASTQSARPEVDISGGHANR